MAQRVAYTPSSGLLLPADVMRMIFGLLVPEDLLRVAPVCRSWNAISSERALWVRHTSQYVQLRMDIDFGALRLKDVCRIVCHGSLSSSTVGKRQFDLVHLSRCTYNPFRHSSPTPLNLLRLARCIYSSWFAIEAMCKRPNTRHAKALVRSVAYLIRVAVLLLFVCALVLGLIAWFKPGIYSVAFFWLPVVLHRPLSFAALTVPLTTACGISVSFDSSLRGVTHSFFFFICLLFGLSEAWPDIVARPYILLLLPLGVIGALSIPRNLTHGLVFGSTRFGVAFLGFMLPTIAILWRQLIGVACWMLMGVWAFHNIHVAHLKQLQLGPFWGSLDNPRSHPSYD